MIRRASSADGAIARPSHATWTAGWSLARPGQRSDYLINTVAALVVAGALFWLQPGLLSSPFDGVFTYLNLAQTAEWQAPGQLLGGSSPLEGMGSRLMPSVPLLQPQVISAWLTPDPSVRVWLTYVILAGVLALATLAYLRAAGVARGTAIAATWLELVLVLTLSDLARAAWGVVYAQAGMLAALAVFLQIGAGGRRWNVVWLAGFVLLVVLFLLADHVFTGYVAGPPLALGLGIHLLAAGSRSERRWKGGALLGAAGTVVLLGIPQWMLALTASISRTVFFDELIAQPQHAYTAGLVFRATDGLTIVYVLAIVGMLGDLALGDRRQRVLATISATASIGLLGAGLLWLLTDLKWRGPAPAFYNALILPWLALSAVRGLDHAISWRPDPATRSTARRFLLPALAVIAIVAFLGLKLLFGSATVTTVLLVVVVLGAARLGRLAGRWPGGAHRLAVVAAYALAIVLVLFTGDELNLGRLRDGPPSENGVQALVAASPPFTRLLREQIGLTPGDRFRGYADVLVFRGELPVSVPSEVLAWTSRDIPTLSQYTYFLSPAYHAFVTRLLDEPADRPNVNHVVIRRVDVRLMRLLGLRYLMLRGAIEPEGLTRVDRQGDYRLYAVPDPNLGTFSPTRAQVVPDARGVLDALANPDFDPRQDVALTEDLGPGELVPAVESSLTFVRGGIRFHGRSPGRSLVVLPVQYTRCLDLRPAGGSGGGAGGAARAVRVNLVETGVLFSGDVELDGRVRFGGPWERCLQDDVADVDRLRLRDLLEPHTAPEYSFPGWRLRLFGPSGPD